MEPNREMIDRLKGLNDAELRELISQIAAATGMSEGARRAAMSHSGMIRRRLQHASTADLQKAIDAIGQEKAAQILRGMKK